jgi:antitoxin CptB
MIEDTRTAVEPPEVRLRRMRMRSWRRGIREMDLVLGGFADAALAELAPAELDAFEALLAENDHDIYQWVAGRAEAPAAHRGTIDRVKAFHGVG